MTLGGLEAQLLLHLSGPYVADGNGWLDNVVTGGRRSVDAALDELLQREPVLSRAELQRAIIDAGIRTAYADHYVRDCSMLRRFGDPVHPDAEVQVGVASVGL